VDTAPNTSPVHVSSQAVEELAVSGQMVVVSVTGQFAVVDGGMNTKSSSSNVPWVSPNSSMVTPVGHMVPG
jgi:hypothetical protein